MLAKQVRTPHVGPKHDGAALGCARQEPGSQAMPGELRRIQARQLGVVLHNLRRCAAIRPSDGAAYRLALGGTLGRC